MSEVEQIYFHLKFLPYVNIVENSNGFSVYSNPRFINQTLYQNVCNALTELGYSIEKFLISINERDMDKLFFKIDIIPNKG